MDKKTKNGVKNGETTQFNSSNQPSSESKKAGWARRKEGLSFMDKVVEFLDMTILELETLEDNMYKHKGNYSVRDMMALQYVFKAARSDKYLLHFLDMHIPKARPIDAVEEAKEKDELKKIIVQIVDGKGNTLNP
jgi:hypothetical protein